MTHDNDEFEQAINEMGKANGTIPADQAKGVTELTEGHVEAVTHTAPVDADFDAYRDDPRPVILGRLLAKAGLAPVEGEGTLVAPLPGTTPTRVLLAHALAICAEHSAGHIDSVGVTDSLQGLDIGLTDGDGLMRFVSGWTDELLGNALPDTATLVDHIVNLTSNIDHDAARQFGLLSGAEADRYGDRHNLVAYDPRAIASLGGEVYDGYDW